MRVRFRTDEQPALVRLAVTYGAAAVAVAAAALVRLWADPWLGVRLPFAPFYIAVLLVAWRAGTGPALFAFALGAVIGDVVFTPPRGQLGSFRPDEVGSILFYFIICSAMILVFRTLRRTAERAQASARNAEEQTKRLQAEMLNRERAEAERQQLALALESQRDRLRTLLANAPAIVWEAWGSPDQASQRIDFVNDYVEPMLGYSRDEWLSTPNFWLNIVHPDDRDVCRAL
jgi:PAS domain-containing protein